MTYTGWLAGQRVTASYLNEMVGVWTDYAITWTASTTNPAIGNGTLTGRYRLVGQSCLVRITVVTGTTTTYGSGSYTWSLPFAPGPGNQADGGGQALTSGGNRTDLMGVISGASVTMWGVTSTTDPRLSQLGSGGVAGTAWNASTAGQTIRFSTEYEIT